MAISALIVPVPQAESLVGDLRRRFDDTTALGVPPHVTILAPFMSPEAITHDVLSAIHEAVSSAEAFHFTLSKVCRWPETTYLSPDPAEPFVALTRALTAKFPAFQPYEGRHSEIVPHLTVGYGGQEIADLTEAELRPRFETENPIQAFCSEFVLLENSSGTWRQLHVIPLPMSQRKEESSPRE